MFSYSWVVTQPGSQKKKILSCLAYQGPWLGCLTSLRCIYKGEGNKLAPCRVSTITLLKLGEEKNVGSPFRKISYCHLLGNGNNTANIKITQFK